MKPSVLVPVGGGPSFGQDIIKVKVTCGASWHSSWSETFSVDKALICARSQFFEDALDDSSEKKDTVVDVIGDPNVFEIYLFLVHTGKIACQKRVNFHDPWMDASWRNIEPVDQLSNLVELYFLSKQLLDFKAMQTTKEGLIEIAKDGRCFLDTEVITRAIKKTQKDDVLRRWLMDVVVESFPKMLQSIEQYYVPEKFWYMVAQRMAADRTITPNGARRWEDFSHYS